MLVRKPTGTHDIFNMKIINQNPYRIIGVFANSKTKERVANINRIKAFAKVNKSAEFPLDLKLLLPDIDRSLEEINRAEANLTLPNDLVKYAQFWFINETPLDEIAFNHLIAGDVVKAIEIWSKKENKSSLHNRIIVLLAENEIQEAIAHAEKFYTVFADDFISNISNNCNVNTETIEHYFIDTLCNELGLDQILPFISNAKWKQHLSSQATTPIIDKLESAVSIAKSSKGKTPDERYNAGKKLANEAGPLLKKLRAFLTPTDVQYQMIADKVGLAVLQCGIDYYNGSDDDDAAHKAMPLQKFALDVVVGKMAKDRCNENVDILQKIINELPPREIATDIRCIKKEIEEFLNNNKEKQSESSSSLYNELFKCLEFIQSDSSKIKKGIILIKKCAPLLAKIKEFEGSNGEYYIQLSSIIVNIVLGKTIESVNKCINRFNNIDSNSRKELIDVLNNAWEATLYMLALDVSSDVKERLGTQMRALESLLWKVGISPISSVDFKIETETETYNKCNSISDYKNYIQLFPNGKYIIKAQKKLEQLQRIIDDKRNELLKKIDTSQSLDEFFKLRKECRWNDILKKLDIKCYSLCQKRRDFKNYIKIFGFKATHHKDALNKIKRGKSLILIIGIVLSVLFVGIVWGVQGYRLLLCIFGVISFIGFIKLRKKEGTGCLLQLCCLLMTGLFFYGASMLGEYIKEKEYDSLYNEANSINTIDGWKNYQMKVPYEEYRDSQQRIDSLEKLIYDSLYKEAERFGTIDGWEKYQKIVPYEEYRDSEHKIDSLVNLAWNTDSKAWKEAQKLNTIFAYKKYIQLYPKGKYAKKAENKIIDLEVADVFAGDYGELPKMDKVSYESGSRTYITVENNTSYTLTLLYSGAESKRLVLKPQASSSISLKNGVYKIAASVNASDVRKYAGTENFNGGSYEGCYYISYTRY